MSPLASLDLFARKKRKAEKIVVITAYDVSSATLAQAGGVDALLVGDSLGNVVQGHESTLPVTLDAMVYHTRIVRRAAGRLPVIADLPYGTFHTTPSATVGAALRLVKEGGAQAVKLEGGRVRETHVRALIGAEIPVMGHLGLTPQSVQRFGGFKVQGRGTAAAAHLVEDAQFLADAGCFAIVLECIPRDLARRITASVPVPTIGIGAGPDCDGQVLVFHDMLGLFPDWQPRFVKRYAELGREATAAIAAYAREVREGAFPAVEHSFDDAADMGGQE